ELLDGTSGLPPYLAGPEMEPAMRKPATFEQLMRRIASGPLSFAPGTGTAPSISEALVLGHVVEIVSHRPWNSYLSEHLFAPAGMTESATMAQERSIKEMARGYRYASGRLSPAPPVDDTWAAGSGDVVTTARDLLEWHAALAGGRIVSPADARFLEQSTLVQGDTLGFDATDEFFPDQHLRIVVLTNTTDDQAGSSASEQIAQALAANALESSSPSLEAFYAAAVAQMDRIVQPKLVTYDLHGASDNIHIGLTTSGHKVWLSFNHGSAPADWHVRHRTQDFQSEVRVGDTSERYVSERPLFDPTWFGSFRALREGMLGYQNDDPARSALAISDPKHGTNAGLPTIASVTTIGPAIYAVQDKGAAECPNGDPGRALHLIPRRRDPRRQLSDAIVDLQSMRFCSIRYGFSGELWFTGFIEQHYANVRGYWIETGGFLDGTLRILGIKTHHFVWQYRLDDLAFPQEIPSSAFVPDPNQ
ncbi:MAG TPA: serine hydrolase domain-containing protein, partial [Candidatus Baltobacteraceae bacterium]|nr:serine hydrolase domain-containing protein [Candidatus Baltobacteraceae bacterium]